jgi:hypothetical protein
VDHQVKGYGLQIIVDVMKDAWIINVKGCCAHIDVNEVKEV